MSYLGGVVYYGDRFSCDGAGFLLILPASPINAFPSLQQGPGLFPTIVSVEKRPSKMQFDVMFKKTRSLGCNVFVMFHVRPPWESEKP